MKGILHVIEHDLGDALIEELHAQDIAALERRLEAEVRMDEAEREA